MKSMRPPSAAIFFMTYFYRAGGGGPWPPWPPPGSATVSSFVSNILRQLSDCVTLQMLQLLQFSLQAEDLDKLLENIVSSHEKELKLWFEFNNLPREFKQKWIKRCKGNTSIDLKFW